MDLLKKLSSFKKPRPVVINPLRTPRGTVSLSYLTECFDEKNGYKANYGHTNHFECQTIASIFRDLGFRIEVVGYNNTDYVPPADCAVAIDIHSNLERWDGTLSPKTKRVLHATGAQWQFWNMAEYRRLQAVFERSGRTLFPRRQVATSRGIDVAEVATVIGNDWTMGTFAHAGKRLERVLLSSSYEYPWAEDRDFETARRRFVWLGSYGMVHKGLDLVLEAFKKMPQYELTVCGRAEKEWDFYQLYQEHLTKTPNIHFESWMDLSSEKFEEIRRTHAGMIYPSSAEGCAGSIVHCAHGGLVPIVTRETGFDIGDYGMRVANGTVEAVIEAVETFANLPAIEVECRARATLEFVQKNHTRALFETNYRRFAEKLVAGI